MAAVVEVAMRMTPLAASMLGVPAASVLEVPVEGAVA